MLPRVRKLHERHPDTVIVIGVHTGKYHRERETAAIAAACQREGVRHPVVNDARFRTWRDHSVQAWPTITIVDPEGYVRAQQAGELPYDGLATFIDQLIEESEEKGTLNHDPQSIIDPPAPEATGWRFLCSADDAYITIRACVEHPV